MLIRLTKTADGFDIDADLTENISSWNGVEIAATARSERIPLVTNNSEHFGRVGGLVLEFY